MVLSCAWMQMCTVVQSREIQAAFSRGFSSYVGIFIFSRLLYVGTST